MRIGNMVVDDDKFKNVMSKGRSLDITKIVLGKDQSDLEKLFMDWTAGKYKSKHEGIFVYRGKAGTGKSTITKRLLYRLTMEGKGSVLFIAFTGKAAGRLAETSGSDAATIHSQVFKIPEGLEEGEKIFFIKKAMLDTKYHYIFVDEISQVSQEMMDMIMSFGVKVVGFGDFRQLPPIPKNKGGRRNFNAPQALSDVFNKYILNPDYELNEVHRQSGDSNILDLADDVYDRRFKLRDLYNNRDRYKKGVEFISEFDFETNPSKYLNDYQIICAYRNTKRALVQIIRNKKGIKNLLPVEGDKVMCIKNQRLEVKGIKMYNGLVGYIQKIHLISQNYMMFDFYVPQHNVTFYEIECELNCFYNDSDTGVYEKPGALFKFDFADVLTCHKSQGSEYLNVVVFAEGWRGEFYRNWYYTAFTRASENLTIVVAEKSTKRRNSNIVIPDLARKIEDAKKRTAILGNPDVQTIFDFELD